MKNLTKYFLVIPAILFMVQGCKDGLTIEPASELSDSFIKTKKGAVAILNSVYAEANVVGDPGINRVYVEEAVTDVFVNYRGALNVDVLPFQSYNWLPTTGFIGGFFTRNYSTIRNANIFLANVDGNTELTAAEIAKMKAEARFCRATAYNFLYGWFGPVPLIVQPFTSSDDNFKVPRATEAEMQAFIESELLAAIPDLPATATETGRATKGAAQGILTKYYLMMKNWTKAAEMAKQVIDGNLYALQSDYTALFAIANKGNKEMIYVFPAVARTGFGNVWTANALPPQYNTPAFNTATQVCMPVAFWRTFDALDKRRALILSSYVNTAGATISLTTGVEYQNPRSLKYPIDPASVERFHADDIPMIRYADILLSRAEALVMSTGTVSTEALGLLNQIRVRAGLAALTLADVPTKDAFITVMLRERAWEFYSEGKRREDLLRHDQLITNATARGLTAKATQVRFPLPQSEIDANSNLIQNPGY